MNMYHELLQEYVKLKSREIEILETIGYRELERWEQDEFQMYVDNSVRSLRDGTSAI